MLLLVLLLAAALVYSAPTLHPRPTHHSFLLQDFPSEESVCLLKRARWFEEHLRFEDKTAARLVEESRLADSMAWQVGGSAVGVVVWGGEEQCIMACELVPAAAGRPALPTPAHLHAPFPAPSPFTAKTGLH